MDDMVFNTMESVAQVELQFQGSGDVREKDAIFNYRRKYLPTQQVS